MNNAIITGNGSVYGGMVVERAIDGYANTTAETCACCTVFLRPAFIELNLKRPYLVTRIEVLGKTDSHEEQFTNIQLETAGKEQIYYQPMSIDSNMQRLKNAVFSPHQSVQFIRLLGSGTGYFAVCEITVYQIPEVIIKTTNMSATQSNTYIPCDASKAIDGNIGNENYSDTDDAILCSMCSVARADTAPTWWQLDLGIMVQAHKVRVYGRRGDEKNAAQSANLLVFVSNSTHELFEGTYAGSIAQSGVENGILLHFNLTIFRFLTILRRTTDVLTLCEVEVYHAECPPGMYGLSCETCGHCKDSVCDQTTGKCTQGCEPGWQIPMCEKACPMGKYGVNCTQDCSLHCADLNSCNSVNGACIGGCQPGYDPLLNAACNLACPMGKYEVNCTQDCNLHCAECM